ncbi:unnamed protein product [Taenia asiatica]|uniref:Uncharacterized protein n=1 Tax=Taenia asiatica TaxID=60517 RepID=A0A0R3WBJ6_TAEAS|nr:unnamed protein product [Taenia asiatica]
MPPHNSDGSGGLLKHVDNSRRDPPPSKTTSRVSLPEGSQACSPTLFPPPNYSTALGIKCPLLAVNGVDEVPEPHDSFVDSVACDNITSLLDPDLQDNSVQAPPSTLNEITFE